jgi:polyisoprenyl-teichoic acid--peptidoglycan teichoic acid transferase
MSTSWQPRAFMQRFFVALVVAAVFSATAIGMAYWVAAAKIDNAKRARFDPGTLTAAKRGKPANFLIIGSDSRSFVSSEADAEHFGSKSSQTGQRSDTIMIAHIDPTTHTGLLVSFPRDLWVDIPGKNSAKLNAAFNGGPQLLVDTIKQNFDIPINHYMEVDFAGFQKIVDAVGTVPIYFPTPARDKETGLDITAAGCHRLDGAQALAYARSREYEYIDSSGEWVRDGTADLGRIRRQQYFIRSLANEAVKTGFRNVTKVNAIINKTVDNLTIDPDLGLSDILALANTFRQVDPSVVQMVTVPTTRAFRNGQDAQILTPEKAAPLFEQLRTFGKVTTPSLPKNVTPAQVHALVLNGSGVGGRARAVSDALHAAGFTIAGTPTNADRNDYTTTEVRYASGSEDQAAYALAYLGGAGKLVKVSKATPGANVVIVLGRDFQQVKAPATTAAPATGAAATTTTVTAVPANPGGGTAPQPTEGC